MMPRWLGLAVYLALAPCLPVFVPRPDLELLLCLDYGRRFPLETFPLFALGLGLVAFLLEPGPMLGRALLDLLVLVASHQSLRNLPLGLTGQILLVACVTVLGPLFFGRGFPHPERQLLINGIVWLLLTDRHPAVRYQKKFGWIGE